MIRKGQFKDQHFDQNLNFLYIEVDKVTERVCSCSFIFPMLGFQFRFLDFSLVYKYRKMYADYECLKYIYSVKLLHLLPPATKKQANCL